MIQTQLIYCGDNINKLKELPDKSVDLIYIDPPFNSNRNYEVFWHDKQETRSFEDRFGDAEHYVYWMRPRIMELYRVLKDTGSFYYHCDWHASHYVKVMLDQVFDFNHFQNEVIWWYRGGGVSKKRWGRRHDSLFFYTKGKSWTFNVDEVRTEYSAESLERLKYKARAFRGEKVYDTYEPNPLGKHPDDVWDMQPIMPSSKERRGYPTQKPLALMDKIIKASSNPHDVVLDAFCGCGTTLVAAHRLKRNWIGIDISPTSCREMAARLQDECMLKEGKDFWVRDLPKTAAELRKYPPFEFENWAVNALNTVIAGGHAIANRAQVGDMGIDGKIYPAMQVKEKVKGYDLFGESDRWFPVQVKQKDKAGRPDIDSFETAMQRQKRNKGFFVSFGFTSDAEKEIKRAAREMDLEIIPVTVQEILDEEVHYRV